MKDLSTLVNTAKENCGLRVELTWSMPRSTKAFRLAVRQDQNADDTITQLWILKEIDGPEAHEIWRAETADLNIVRDACYKHCGPPATKKVGTGKSSAVPPKGAQPAKTEAVRKDAKATTKPGEGTVKRSDEPMKNVEGDAKGTTATLKDAAATTKDADAPVKVAEATGKDAEPTAKGDQASGKETEATAKGAEAPVIDSEEIAKHADAPVKDADTTVKDAERTADQDALASKTKTESGSSPDGIIEEDSPQPHRRKPGSPEETIETLTETLSELLEVEVEEDLNELDIPQVVNDGPEQPTPVRPELAAVERMRKIIQARQNVAAVRELKADLKLPLISKDPTEASKTEQEPQPANELPSEVMPQLPDDDGGQDETFDDDDDNAPPDQDAKLFDVFGEDGAGARVLENQLVSPKTAFYSTAAFFKFLEHEFYRFESNGTPLSLIIFGMHHDQQISTQAATAVALRIGLVKRRLDILGHCGENDYAILLPNSLGTTAALIASRAHDALTASPLAERFDNSSIAFSFGIANLPDNGNDIPSLVEAARAAKERARQGSCAIIMARSSN